MAVANVTVKYVNQPNPGKKKGSIRLDTGEYIGVWADKMHLFQPGNSYRIIYKEDEYGKTFTAFAGEDNQAPQRPTTKPNGFTRPGGGHPSKDPVEIFVTGTVQQWLNGAGKAGKNFPDVNRMAEMVHAAREGWRLGWQDAGFPAPSDDVPNDEIPF